VWLADRLAERQAEQGWSIPRSHQPRFRNTSVWPDLWAQITYPAMTRMLLVPIAASWLIPAMLSWTGAVNADVGPLEHTTMLRRMAGRWDIELIAMDDERLIMHTPWVLSVKDGLTAALEAFLYCPDVVEQGLRHDR
jgi:hypothetical protein